MIVMFASGKNCQSDYINGNFLLLSFNFKIKLEFD